MDRKLHLYQDKQLNKQIITLLTETAFRAFDGDDGTGESACEACMCKDQWCMLAILMNAILTAIHCLSLP